MVIEPLHSSVIFSSSFYNGTICDSVFSIMNKDKYIKPTISVRVLEYETRLFESTTTVEQDDLGGEGGSKNDENLPDLGVHEESSFSIGGFDDNPWQ